MFEFTIVTVVYNDRDGFLATKKSILNQSYSNFQWVVIDGGSTDGTSKEVVALSSINRNIKYITEKDEGIYDAMNKGIGLALGRYILFMNAGDQFSNDEVLSNVAEIVREDLVDIVLGGATLVFRNGRGVYRKPRDISYIWHGLPASHQAIYFKRTLVDGALYDTAYNVCGDYYLLCEIVRKSNMGLSISYLDKPLVNFRVGDTSYENPYLLLKEPYLIQRDVLGVSLFKRICSLGKRVISILGVVVITRFG